MRIIFFFKNKKPHNYLRFLSEVDLKSSLYFLCYVMENIGRKQDEGNKWFITKQEYSGI